MFRVSLSPFALILLIYLALPLCCLANGISIVVEAGPFETQEQAAASEKAVDWWDGDSADDTACTECFAALELRRFLAACTEFAVEDIVLASPQEAPGEGVVFLLGSRESNAWMEEIAVEKQTIPQISGAFGIQTKKEQHRILYIIEGYDRQGTLYGVYAFLKELGIRFYGLGEKGTVLPKKPVVLDKVIHKTESPKYLTRGFWAWEDRGNEAFFLWMARNGLNFWTAEEAEFHFLKKLGMKLTAGGHVIQPYFLNPADAYPYDHPAFERDENKPADPYPVSEGYQGDTNGDGKLSYFEAHPEWYAFHEGKRINNMKEVGGYNFCTSNADARKELAKNFVQSLIDGRWQYVDVSNFWMLDVGKWCQCEACKAQGTYTDRMFAVVHAALEAMREARQDGRLPREVELSTLAYHETLSPPSKPLPEDFDYAHCSVTFFPIERCYVHPLADPACVEINQRLFDNYTGWTMGPGRHYTGSIFIGEYYNVSSLKSLPCVFTRIMAADIPWYYKNGARHFHYMHTPTRLWGTWALNQYFMAQLLWNPDCEVDGLVKAYFQRFYPTTSNTTRKFYHYLEKAFENIKALKHYVRTPRMGYSLRGRLTDTPRDIFPLDHFKYEKHDPIMNNGPDFVEIVEFMRLARKALDRSLGECSDAKEQDRLLEDERRFAYGEAMIGFYYHMARTARFHHQQNTDLARREFVRVERCASQLRQVTDLVQVSSTHANAENGLVATQAVNRYEFFKKTYGE